MRWKRWEIVALTIRNSLDVLLFFQVLSDHPDVAEVAVIGIRDSMKGQVPIGLLVLNTNCKRDEEAICSEVVAMVRDKIGPVACFRKAEVVKRLPKTRSGKILRNTLRAIGNHEQYKIPATCDDPAVFDEIAAVMRAHEDL